MLTFLTVDCLKVRYSTNKKTSKCCGQ